MKENAKKTLLSILILGIILFFGFQTNKAVAIDDPCLSKSGQDKLKCYNDQVDLLSSQAKTLSNQIAQYNAQINLTQLKIAETESKIAMLGGRIDQLETSLDSLTTAFSSRAVETYKLSRFENNFVYIFSASDVNDAVSRFHYLQKIQQEDTDLMEKLQTAQTVYKGQKNDQETLQVQLKSQKDQLDQQKADKANLLAVTQNNENIFAKLRDEAAAELAAVAGLGQETFIRDVNAGDVIGNIISSASGCSSGRHLHFEVHQGDSLADPNNYLSAVSFGYSYDQSQYGYFGTINPHGGWLWPISDPIIINQGFGSHGFAATFYPNGIHTGIDIDSGSSTQVKAVHSGKLYGGSYQCGGSYPGNLLYAKVDNGDGTTVWYLHMIPQ